MRAITIGLVSIAMAFMLLCIIGGAIRITIVEPIIRALTSATL